MATHDRAVNQWASDKLCGGGLYLGRGCARSLADALWGWASAPRGGAPLADDIDALFTWVFAPAVVPVVEVAPLVALPVPFLVSAAGALFYVSVKHAVSPFSCAYTYISDIYKDTYIIIYKMLHNIWFYFTFVAFKGEIHRKHRYNFIWDMF